MRHVSLLWLWLLQNADGASKSTNEHGAHKKGRGKEHNSQELPHVTLKSKTGKELHVTLSSKERAQQRHDNIVARNQAAQRAEDADGWEDPLRRQRAARQRLRHRHAAFVPPSRDAAPLCDEKEFPMRVRSYSQLNAVWKSSSELGYVILHTIEQTRLRGHLRVGGVQTPRHRADAVTGTTSRRRRGAPEV